MRALQMFHSWNFQYIFPLYSLSTVYANPSSSKIRRPFWVVSISILYNNLSEQLRYSRYESVTQNPKILIYFPTRLGFSVTCGHAGKVLLTCLSLLGPVPCWVTDGIFYWNFREGFCNCLLLSGGLSTLVLTKQIYFCICWMSSTV